MNVGRRKRAAQGKLGSVGGRKEQERKEDGSEGRRKRQGRKTSALPRHQHLKSTSYLRVRHFDSISVSAKENMPLLIFTFNIIIIFLTCNIASSFYAFYPIL